MAELPPPPATGLLRCGPSQLRLQLCHAPLLLGSLTWKADKPEPEKVVPDDGVVPEAVGRPAELGGVEPRAAAQDTGRASGVLDPGAAIIGCVFVIIVPVVLDPFHYIPVHVVQPPGIGGFLRNRMCSLFSIASIPSIFAKVTRIISK